MSPLKSWRHWSWNEIYLSLMRERELGEVFEIDEQLIADPLQMDAELGDLGVPWHYRFVSPDGYALCIQHRGDRYMAWLEQFDLSRRQVNLSEAQPEAQTLRDTLPALVASIPLQLNAVAAGLLVVCGSVWVVVERTLLAAG